MSYDPYAAGSDLPGESGPSPAAPGGFEQIKGRVQAPAICLIVVGVLNMLLMMFQVGRTVFVALTPAQQLAKERDEMLENLEKANVLPKDFKETYKKQQQDQSPEDFKNQTVLMSVLASVIGGLIALLPLLGGIRMLSLRSYGLCVVGSICAALPCLSCGGTCCFGEVIGIWALIVLINADVRAAFR